MIAIFDVQYEPDRACAACVVATDWVAVTPAAAVARVLPVAQPYVPGQFFLRELPPLLSLIDELELAPGAPLVVDGYVWLEDERAGLGGHLFERLGREHPVVGVAKSEYAGAPAQRVVRGRSSRPLFVTAAGVDPAQAAESVRVMHGEFRIPTLLKEADRLARRFQDAG